MPTYSYRRDDGTLFDHFQRITDPALTVDPKTGRPVVRVISGGAGLQFKGSGFYLTDYVKKSGGDSTSDSDSGPKGSSEKGSSEKGSGSAEPKSGASEPAPRSAPTQPAPSKPAD